jgi:hypothetical protein
MEYQAVSEGEPHIRRRMPYTLWNGRLARDVAPAIAALFVAVIFLLFFGRSGSGWGQTTLGAIFRFFRNALILCIPLSVLLPLYCFIVEMKKKVLVRVEQAELTVKPLKHWLLRPFQGIGIAFLFRTKLVTMLQLMGGPVLLLRHGGDLDVRRLLLTSAIIVCVSLLLSILWTLDDMGIRYANRKDQELKMIGKYVGTLMPVIFGIYGVYGLMSDYPFAKALVALVRAVLLLYPPFVCFTVLHAYVIRSRAGFAAKGNTLEQGGVWRENGEKSLLLP